MNIINCVLEFIKKNSEILFIGIPLAKDLVALLEEQNNITVFDSDEGKLKEIQQKFNVKTEKKNMDFLLLPIRKYSAIITYNYTFNISLLREISKALVPKGFLILTAKILKNYIPFQSQIPRDVFKPNEILRYLCSLNKFNILYYSELEDEVQLLAKTNI